MKASIKMCPHDTDAFQKNANGQGYWGSRQPVDTQGVRYLRKGSQPDSTPGPLPKYAVAPCKQLSQLAPAAYFSRAGFVAQLVPSPLIVDPAAAIRIQVF